MSQIEKLALLRLKHVIARTGQSRSAIYRAEAAGDFPRRVKLGVRSVAWLASEIDAWIAQRVSASRVAL